MTLLAASLKIAKRAFYELSDDPGLIGWLSGCLSLSVMLILAGFAWQVCLATFAISFFGGWFLGYLMLAQGPS